MRVVPFLQYELCKIGTTTNPSKTVALPPKGHVPTPEEIALLGGIGVRLAEGWGVKAVGVPIGNDAFLVNSTLENGEQSNLHASFRVCRTNSRRPHRHQLNDVADFSHLEGN